MENVEEFLAHAIRLEEEAATRLNDLSHAMKTYGNHESAAFFGKLAHFSRLHLAQARARAGYHDIPQIGTDEFDGRTAKAPRRLPWKRHTI